MNPRRYRPSRSYNVEAGTWDRVEEWADETFDDLAAQGSRNLPAANPEHGVSVAVCEAVPHSDVFVDDRRNHGWHTCGCGERFPTGDAMRSHFDRVHR